jgi:hypothetical protein
VSRARRIILDCDPGHDDALAIMLAHGTPEIEICAITTVAGNHPLQLTTLNALRVCSLAGIRGVPVAAGCETPLLRELGTAPEIHGEAGLEGYSWAEPSLSAVPEHAVDLIIGRAADPLAASVRAARLLRHGAAAGDRGPRPAAARSLRRCQGRAAAADRGERGCRRGGAGRPADQGHDRYGLPPAGGPQGKRTGRHLARRAGVLGAPHRRPGANRTRLRRGRSRAPLQGLPGTGPRDLRTSTGWRGPTLACRRNDRRQR